VRHKLVGERRAGPKAIVDVLQGRGVCQLVQPAQDAHKTAQTARETCAIRFRVHKSAVSLTTGALRCLLLLHVAPCRHTVCCQRFLWSLLACSFYCVSSCAHSMELVC
jgi:hypothetical protein